MKQIIYLAFMVVLCTVNAHAAGEPVNVNALGVEQTIENDDYLLFSDKSANGLIKRHPKANLMGQLLSKTNTEPYEPTLDYHPATRKFVLENGGGGDAMLDVVNTWPAKQIFAGGAEASLSGANLTSWDDLLFNGVKIVDANALINDDNKILPASKIYEIKSEIEDQIVTSSSGYVTMSAAPYSDVPCPEGARGIYNSVEYKCFGGFWSLQVALSSYVNTGGTTPPPVGTISHYLDFDSDAVTDLAGGFTLVHPTGVATVDSTAYGVLAGTQSALLRNNASGINEILSPTFDPQSTVYYKYMAQAQTGNTSYVHGISLYSSGLRVAHISLEGGYRAYHGDFPATIFASPQAGTTYYVCGKFVAKEAGDNGVHAVNIGTFSDPQLNDTTTISTGNGTGLVDQWSIAQFSSNHILVDEVWFQNSPITGCGTL